MFVLGNFKESPDEVLMKIIQIACDAQNSKELPKGYKSPSALAGYKITEYLWKINAIKVVQEPKRQMTLDDFMREHSDGKRGMDKNI